MQIDNESPQKITEQHSLSLQVPTIAPEIIEQELAYQYEFYRRKKMREPLRNIKRMASRLLGSAVLFLHELWREVVPEVIRGQMQEMALPSQRVEEKEGELFEEYRRKRTAFFLISFRDDCSEEEVQEAYLQATTIVPEGFSLKYEELYRSTNFALWNIEKPSRTEKYSIHVLKFDLFAQLLWFGTLSSDSSVPLEGLKRELGAALKGYEEVEQSFLGSYIEKEDRFALDPQEK